MYKTVLITGASRGIGRAIACAFAREGCRLVINCSHSEKELLALADELRETCHVDVLTSIGDVSDYTYMEQLFSQSEARFGGIDILVNNAGISHIGLLEDMTIDEWNRIIGVNLTSVFSASKLASVLITSIFSPCAWMISFTMERPRPVPRLSLPLERSVL